MPPTFVFLAPHTKPVFIRLFCLLTLYVYGLFAAENLLAQEAKTTATPPAALATDRNLNEWLVRTHEASRRRAYTGTFVVSAGNTMAAARMWHVCDGTQQMERVDTLTGAPRTTLRRNDEVVTFVPESRVAVWERRESLGPFPALLRSQTPNLSDFYSLRQAPQGDRVAGFETEVFDVLPRDALRFGYRIWSEKKTGLMVKLQTLDADQRVLEQVAFSELQLDAPVRMDQLLKQMKARDGYAVQHHKPVPTSALSQGWQLKTPVPGFAPVSCHVREEAAAGRSPPPMQWVFSDGLASVSVFAEPFDPKRHGSEGAASAGATHSQARRVGDFWLTAVGEAPPQALRQFVQQMERTR
jgi:sigma-E factor negative regulatory protein RseB